MNTQKEKPMEPNEGASALTTKPQFSRKHETSGDPQTEKGDYRAGVVKTASSATEGRHVVAVENGFDSAKRRSDEIARARKASEAGIVSARSPRHVQNTNMEGKRGSVPFGKKSK